MNSTINTPAAKRLDDPSLKIGDRVILDVKRSSDKGYVIFQNDLVGQNRIGEALLTCRTVRIPKNKAMFEGERWSATVTSVAQTLNIFKIRGKRYGHVAVSVTGLKREEVWDTLRLNSVHGVVVRKLRSGNAILRKETLPVHIVQTFYLYKDEPIHVVEAFIGRKLVCRAKNFFSETGRGTMGDDVLRLLPPLSERQYAKLGKFFVGWDNLLVLSRDAEKKVA